MQKWRYDVIELDFRGQGTHEGVEDGRVLQATLEELGTEGWELVNAQIVGKMVYLFLKIPVIEPVNVSAKGRKPRRLST